jgi:hypothetical protein
MRVRILRAGREGKLRKADLLRNDAEFLDLPSGFDRIRLPRDVAAHWSGTVASGAHPSWTSAIEFARTRANFDPQGSRDAAHLKRLKFQEGGCCSLNIAEVQNERKKVSAGGQQNSNSVRMANFGGLIQGQAHATNHVFERRLAVQGFKQGIHGDVNHARIVLVSGA